MVEALLCDIDGTLVQSNWLHAEAWQVALAGINIDLELENVRRQIGKGGDELIPVFVPWWMRDAVKEPLEAYRKFVFQQDYMPRVKALPQAREFLLRVKEAGIKIALASSASKEDLLQSAFPVRTLAREVMSMRRSFGVLLALAFGVTAAQAQTSDAHEREVHRESERNTQYHNNADDYNFNRIEIRPLD